MTSVYSYPHQMMDVFNQHAIHAVLEQCGFYLPILPSISALVNDKVATNLTLTDSPVDPLVATPTTVSDAVTVNYIFFPTTAQW